MKHLKPKKKNGWKAAAVILSVLVILLGFSTVWLAKDYIWPAQSIEPAGETPEQASEPVEQVKADADVKHTVKFSAFDQDPIVMTVADGENLFLPNGPEMPGYTFLAWRNADGTIEHDSSVRVYQDMEYRAEYAVAFKNAGQMEEHEAYMFLDENNMFHPNAALSRGELVTILYKMLNINSAGTGYFADITDESEYHEAAATLKSLNLIGGERLHPEDPVLYGELFNILAKLFPEPADEHVFTNVQAENEYYKGFCLAKEKGWLLDDELDPYAEVTRKETARIINMLTGRKGAQHEDLSQTGTIVDVSSDDAYFSDIAEAVIPHKCDPSAETETWTESEPVETLAAGRFFIGTDLHCIKENGDPCLNETVDGILFDENGIASTGDAELDAYVRQKLPELVDPETMSSEDMLRKIYDFVRDDSFYLRGAIYETGETGWEVEEAVKMLSTGKGNCYSYAATFWALTRAIGYDTVCYSGTIGTHSNPHGWTEIEFDGTPYIFDPTLEYEQWYGPGTHTFERFFKKPYESVTGWLYARG